MNYTNKVRQVALDNGAEPTEASLFYQYAIHRLNEEDYREDYDEDEALQGYWKYFRRFYVGRANSLSSLIIGLSKGSLIPDFYWESAEWMDLWEVRFANDYCLLSAPEYDTETGDVVRYRYGAVKRGE